MLDELSVVSPVIIVTTLPSCMTPPLPLHHERRDVHTFSGLAQSFFGLATMPLAFERVLSQQPPVKGQLIAAALPLVNCGFDHARKTVRASLG